MYKKNYSFKKIFSLHFRIGLLITLVAFILGFQFFPEIEMNTQYPEIKLYNIITIDPFEPDIKLVNIVEPVIIGDPPFKRPILHPFPLFVPYDTSPKLLNLDKVNFEYPKELVSLGIEGTVYLELWIDKEGNVRNVILIQPLHPDLDKIAVENAWKLKFSPAMQRDKPVAVRYSFPIKFKLE